MKLGLDLDNTLIDYHGHSDNLYYTWFRHRGINAYGAPLVSMYDTSARYGVSRADAEAFEDAHADIYFRDVTIQPPAIEFVRQLLEEGFDLTIITHREASQEQGTHRQLEPLYRTGIKLPIVFVDDLKSDIMLSLGVKLLLDDSPSVILDVSRVPGLTVFSESFAYNTEFMNKHYSTYAEALELIHAFRKENRL